MNSPRISAIVLNYNNPDDSVACIESLLRCRHAALHIVMVDNGSSDHSEEKIRAAYPDLEILQTGKNLGFAAGNNLAIRHVMRHSPDFVLLLNNDTLVEPGFLTPLVEALQSDPQAAAAGGTIFYYPSTDRVWYAGGKFVYWRGTAVADHVDRPRDLVPNGGIHPVSFLTGCMMLVRASVIEQLGMFDERYFMYLEDVEFSQRLVAAGYRLLYVPDSRIYHKVRSTGNSPLQVYYGFRNRFLLTDTVLSGSKRRVAQTYLHCVLWAKVLLWWLPRPGLRRAACMGYADFRRRNFHEGRGLRLLSRGFA